MVGRDQSGERAEKVAGMASSKTATETGKRVRRCFRRPVTDEHAILRRRDIAIADLFVRCRYSAMDLADIFGLSRRSVYRAIKDCIEASLVTPEDACEPEIS